MGRAGVLRRLRRVIDELSQQAPPVGLVLVVGEEGVGKGRLLLEVAEHATKLGVRALTARPSLSEYVWYRPFTDLLGGGDGGSAGSALLRSAPDPSAAARLKERALARLRGMAASRPVALFVHDLDRADPFTVEMLDHLPRHRGRAPAVVVASVAPGIPSFPYQRLREEPFCRELHLAPWNERDVEQFLRSRPPFAAVASSMAEMMARRTGGKPALVIEILRLMQEEGFAPERGMEPAVAMERLHAFRVPQDLEEVMARRLACHAGPCQRVVLALSAYSRSASTAEVGAAAGLSPDEASTALGAAEEAGFAVGRSARGETAWEIRSRNVGQALLHAARPEEVAPIHARIAAMLSERTGSTDPVELAIHHARAGHAAEAARWGCEAREAFMAARAFEQGLSLCEECLALSPSGADAASLQQAASDFCFALSLFERSLRYAAAAREAWERLVRPAMAAGCRLREARIHQARSDFVMAARAAHDALARFRAAGDEEGEARALSEVGLVEQSRGRFPEAAESLEKALRIQRARGDREGLLDTCNTLGTLHYYTGAYEAARALYQEGLEIASALGRRLAEKRAHSNLANLEMVAGRAEAAHGIYRKVLALEKDLGDVYGEAITRYNIGVVLQQSMRYGLALRQYAAAARLMERVGNRRGLHSTLVNSAAVHLSVEDLAACGEILERASRLSVEVGDRRAEAATLLALGTYHAAAGSRARALDYLEAALAKAIAIRDRRHEMESRYWLALTSLKLGPAAEAGQHVATLLELARAGREPEFLAKAQYARGLQAIRLGDGAGARASLMAALGAARMASSQELQIEIHCRLPEALTLAGDARAAAREREKVARLVRQIAARIGSARLRRLYLEGSPRREILSGEGTSSRAAS